MTETEDRHEADTVRARDEYGVVVGRVHGQLISIKTDQGDTRTVRVLPDLGARLELGQRAKVTVNETGRATGVSPVPDAA